MPNTCECARRSRRPGAPMLLGLVCVVLAAFGCADERPAPTAKVEGTVTFGDQPVAAGEVVFMTKGTGFAATAPVVDGKYKMESPIEAGVYTVLVTPAPPPPPDPVNPLPPPKEPKDIPEKYRSEVTSPLTASVEGGENEVSFNLEP